MTDLFIKAITKDSDIKDPAVRGRCGTLGSVVGILLNVILFAGKFVAGLLAGSVSVTADAFNNLSDAGSSVLAFAGFKFAGRPADKEHPFGHGRMEYVTGLIISFVIMMMGFELVRSSLAKIIHPQPPVFSRLSLAVLIASVLVKLWMFSFNRSLGKMISSKALSAASMDSLTDAAATLAVIISILLSLAFDINVDGFAGILVSLFIMYTGIETFRDSLTPLLGTRPDKELVQELHDRIMSYPDIVGIHDMIVHDYGVGNMIVSLHAEVPLTMDFVKAHELIDIIEDDLKSEYNCVITIHIDPIADKDEETLELKEICKKVVKEIDVELTIHDFRITKGTNHINMIFDVVVPYGFKYSDSHTAELIREKLKDIDERYFAVINVDKDMA